MAMRDFIFVPPEHGEIDPLRRVAAQARRELPKRFYAAASIQARGAGFAILLDGRALKTPLKSDLLLPGKALAAMIAEEWAVQGERIDSTAMPLTRLANSALCGVAQAMAATFEETLAYAGSDALCYRADAPAELVALQAAAWDPVIEWARTDLGARFVPVEGIVHAAQPQAALDAVRTEAARLVGEGPRAPFRLAALNVMTALTGSLLLSLYCAILDRSPETVWTAAHVDEDFEIGLWGEDAVAKTRRAGRWRDFVAACAMLRATEDPRRDAPASRS